MEVEIIEGEEAALGVNVRHPIATDGILCVHKGRRRGSSQTRSHPEMVGDMSRVTLNFDLSKIPFVRF